MSTLPQSSPGQAGEQEARRQNREPRPETHNRRAAVAFQTSDERVAACIGNQPEHPDSPAGP